MLLRGALTFTIDEHPENLSPEELQEAIKDILETPGVDTVEMVVLQNYHARI